ncbi:caspase family protein [Xenococcus sp. PCC 7305]|uniref:nSTAND1 domain-containing NTPase n=1 Tax=Xenococcus sp. PCC 7305 TaxID=102125 RepID=UPI0003089EF1|nr:caspase family protein [Xenococcus sp. PCC 7305]
MSKSFDRSIAIVIGINEYQNGIAPLQTPVSDAIAIATILSESYQYHLIHPDFNSGVILNEYAKKEQLKNLFTDILPNQIKPTNRDRLLLYFAGHGLARNSDIGPEGYLVPQDGDIKQKDSLLRMIDLHDWLSQLHCRHLLVILDCCFAGTFRWASTRKLIPIPEKIHWEHYHRFIKYPAWQVITSAAHNQEALDFLNNRDRDNSKKHSPFAEGLIKALGDRQADLIADGVITTPELYLYLRDYVGLSSQERQTPGFFPLKNHDRGEYIFKLPDLEPDLEPAPPLDKNHNPYRGLESFEERHADLFFGRQEVIQELAAKVGRSQQQLTVVLGISGSGKSSLVKAGLIPYLRQKQAQKWLILNPLRPGTNPHAALARGFSQLDKYYKPVANTTMLGQRLQDNLCQYIKAIKAWSQQHPNSRLLLVIDQFEELITLEQKTISAKPLSKLEPPQITAEKTASWQEFITLLVDILKKCPQLSLVITLRSDFEPRFLKSALASDWENSRFVVRAMRSDELRDAVVKPATEMALYFEPANLVDRLLDEVAQTAGALPLLSFALSQMYVRLHRAWLEEGQEERALTVDEDFEQSGGVAGSLTRRANEEYDKLPDDAHRLTMSRVMLRMVEIEGGEVVKRRVLKPELIYPSEAENQRVSRVLSSLVETRLIVTGKEAETDSIYYEPAHDFLVRGWDKLQDWLSQDQQQDNLALQRLLTPAAVDWQNKSKSRLFLWNANPRLDLLQQILHSQDSWFNKIETEFVRSSIARKRFNVRFRRGSAIAIMSLLATGLIFALFGETNAQIGQSKASNQSAKAGLTSKNTLDSMVDSLRAAKLLKNPLVKILNPQKQLQKEITGTLLWSIHQVKEVNRLQGSTVPVRSVISPQGDLIASAEDNGWIRLWNLQGEKLANWQADNQRVWAVSFSPDQKLLVSGSENGKIRLWNLENKILSGFALEGRGKMAEGRWFKSASSYDSQSSQDLVTLIAQWQGHPGILRDVSFSHNGQLIASAGGEDGTVALWDREGKQLARWQAHKAPTKNVSFSPDDQLVVTTGGEKTIRLWNLQGELLWQVPVHSWQVSFSPDGQLIASAGDNGLIEIWDRQYQQIASWPGDRTRLWNLAFSPDSKSIATAGEDGTARVWDFRGQQLDQFSRHSSPVRTVSFSKDGKLLVSSGDDGTTRLWNLQKQTSLTWQGDRNRVQGLTFSPDGKSLVSGGTDGIVHFWDLQGKQLSRFTSQNLGIKTIGISSDGDAVASVSEDGVVHISNLQNESLGIFATQVDLITTIVFHPEEQMIAIAGSQGTIKLYNLQGELIRDLPTYHNGLVNSLTFSPNSKFLASAGEDGLVIAWDWQNQRLHNMFQDHIGEVHEVTFSSDGKWLASAGRDGTIRRWNVNKNSTQSPFHVYGAEVNSVVYSPDGKTIISGDNQGSVWLWDLDTGKTLATWKAHKSGIEDISLHPEGNLLATTGQNGEIKLWKIDSFEQLITQVCSWMGNYLNHNVTVDNSDRNLCKHVP